MKNVLIIEDDHNISDLLEIHLRDLECKVTKAFDGEKGLSLAKANRFDLVILDLMLPRLDGLEVCRQLRSEKQYTPVLMLTAKSDELDKVWDSRSARTTISPNHLESASSLPSESHLPAHRSSENGVDSRGRIPRNQARPSHHRS